MAILDNFFLRFKSVCSLGVTAICIDTFIEIAHRNHTEWVWNPFMCDITHTNASQSYYMNSLIDIHTTHFIAVAFTKKSHRANEPLGTDTKFLKTLK